MSNVSPFITTQNTMITKNGKKFGGAQPGAGRKKHEGSRHMYTVADDVHEWIMLHGGGQYLTDMFRAIMHVEALEALERKKAQQK